MAITERVLALRNRKLKKRFAKIDALLKFKKPLPILHALEAKLGSNSVNIGANKVHFDDAAANPVAAGEVQRNGTDLKFHDGTTVKSLIGTAGTGFYKELGRTELSVAGDLIQVSGLTAKKNLMILILLEETGQATCKLTFNGDGATNYAYRYSLNGGADGTAVSDTGIGAFGLVDRLTWACFIRNVATKEKLAIIEQTDQNGAGAANAPSRGEIVAKWTNTADQITRVDVNNTAVGDFAVGSTVIVLGDD